MRGRIPAPATPQLQLEQLQFALGGGDVALDGRFVGGRQALAKETLLRRRKSAHKVILTPSLFVGQLLAKVDFSFREHLGERTCSRALRQLESATVKPRGGI